MDNIFTQNFYSFEGINNLDYDMELNDLKLFEPDQCKLNDNLIDLLTGDTVCNSGDIQPQIFKITQTRTDHCQVSEEDDFINSMNRVYLTDYKPYELDPDVEMREESNAEPEDIHIIVPDLFSTPIYYPVEPIDMSVFGQELQLRRDNYFKLFQVKLYASLEKRINDYMQQRTGEGMNIQFTQYIVKEVTKKTVVRFLQNPLQMALTIDYSSVCKINNISVEKMSKVLLSNIDNINKFTKKTGGTNSLFDEPLKYYVSCYMKSDDFKNDHRRFTAEKVAHSNFRQYNIEYKKEINNYLEYFLGD
jgi:hypothetical protein